jgi:hypothetical protein
MLETILRLTSRISLTVFYKNILFQSEDQKVDLKIGDLKQNK